jgi:thiamine-monophosphate kinase
MITIADLGEKRLIAEFIKPLFNPEDSIFGVGDDCGMLMGEGEEIWLFSTDRVPSDLIAFRLGIIDYAGLGKYLATLNLSDIAACGGSPVGLLLNLGMPSTLLYADFRLLCQGFNSVASLYDCKILGGDITSSSELSISATSIGRAKKGRVLTRRGAKPGDTLICSRPLGLTPAAFAFLLREEKAPIDEADRNLLLSQFSALEPLVPLGLDLGASRRCSSCMDNTDGLGQSLLELGLASGVAFVIDEKRVHIPPVVKKIAAYYGEEPVSLAFSAGADFSLVGTLEGRWSDEDVASQFGGKVKVIGYAERGVGVFRESPEGRREPLQFSGWNYFTPT